MNKKIKRTSILLGVALIWVVLSACSCGLLPQAAVAFANSKVPQKVASCSGCDKPIDGSLKYEPGQTYKIGDIINVDGVYITILGWDAPNIIDLAIFNRTAKEIPVFTLSQMHLRDASGDNFTVTPFTSVTLSIDLDKNLAPGDFMHGQVGFITNLNVSGKNMSFVYDMDGSDKTEVIISLGDAPMRQPLQPVLVEAVTGQVANPGEPFQVGDIQYTVTNIHWLRGTSAAKPMPGAIFVLMDVKVKNVGGITQTFSPIAQMRVVDEALTKYQISLLVLGAEKDAYLPQSDHLKPGQTITGQVGFEIPARATRLAMFTKDYYDGGLRSYMAIPLPAKPEATPTAVP